MMDKVAVNMSAKTAAFKQAFASPGAMVKYLEAPMLEGDEDSAENRRVSYGLASRLLRSSH